MGEQMDEMKELIEDFLQETSEILDNLDQDLVTLEDAPEDMDLLNRIFRGIHTLKGTSGFLGFEKMMEVAHKAEDILNKLRKGELKLTPKLMDVILEAVDVLKALYNDIRETGGESQNVEDIIKKLQNTLKEEEAAQKGEEERGEEEKIPEEEIKVEKKEVTKEEEKALEEIKEVEKKESAKEEEDKAEEKEVVPKMLGEILVEKNLVTEDEIAKAALKQKKLGEILVEENIVSKEDIKKALDEQKKIQKKAKTVTESKTIRVNVERLDTLMNLIGELVLERNRLLDIERRFIGSEKLRDSHFEEEFTEISDRLNLITTQLQMAVLKMRMLPIGRVFNKFPRVVRDLSRKMKKEVELLISGEETELDKSVIEELNDPLVHIIRNSIDHGIEPPEEREKAGKPRKGKIWLDAFQEGNHIVISVKDDGKGIDVERIKEKVIEKGLSTPEKLAQMDDKEIVNFIFAPGFSTAKQVSDVSGRGVGMDVVKTNIKKINGTIEVKTEKGVGTELILKLPLTLAIIQALLVKVSSERFAIPLTVVEETVRVNKDEIKSVERNEVLNLRDTVLPLVRLTDIFNISKNGEEASLYVVVVRSAEQKFGIVVDKLIGQEEIVIKSLGDLLRDIKGISGATIMGDGRVTLIIDVAAIMFMAKSQVS